MQVTGYAKGGTEARYLPGEFEKQQAMWLMWPSEIYQGERSVTPAMANIVKSLVPYIQVNIMAANTSEVSQIKKVLASYGCTGANIHYCIINHQTIWARDVGPIFVKDNRNRLSVVDFQFNNYGRYGDQYYVATEGKVDELAAKFLKLPVINSQLVSEGGSVESNGKGTILLTESVALKHNNGLTKKQIEDEYRRVLGAKKIIWLKCGLAEDKVTDGHVDEFVRFADPNTILLAQVLPEERNSSSLAENSYLNLEENYKILLAATDQNGKHFNIVRIPMPLTLYQDAAKAAEIPVRSYLNYVVTNDAVLIQTYWKPERPYILKISEVKIMNTFKSVFPGRKIIGINAENINSWGGGLHCVTQHMPVGNLTHD